MHSIFRLAAHQFKQLILKANMSNLSIQYSALVLSAALLAGCGSTVNNPVTGQGERSVMSEAAEIAEGKKAHAQVLQEYGVLQNPRVQAYVNAPQADFAQVVANRRVEQRVGRDIHGVLRVRPAVADITHAAAQAQSKMRPTSPAECSNRAARRWPSQKAGTVARPSNRWKTPSSLAPSSRT